jgi:pimeloyl-ACP methyl ester carboxylesterase
MKSMALMSVSSKPSIDEGYATVSRAESDKYSLYYRIYNKDDPKIPLVIVHGGPSLPSQYLYPIVDNVDKRSVIFYDQLGCGKSDEPKQIEYYSISQCVSDLESLLEQLDIPHVHLLGHSFGGNVAYEYCRHFPARVKSLILANTSTNMKKCLEEYNRLEKSSPSFWEMHACRQVPMPGLLLDAMKHGGRTWCGMEVVVDYVAEPLLPESQRPTLLISGKYDFGTAAAENWHEILPSIENDVVLVNSAHYIHLEADARVFGEILSEFMAHHDVDD